MIIRRAFIVSLGISNTIRAFKIGKKEDSNIHIMQAAIEDFPKVNNFSSLIYTDFMMKN